MLARKSVPAPWPTKVDARNEADRPGVRAFINKDTGSEITMTKVLADYMNKVHGLEYDLSVRGWNSVKGSRRAKTTTDSPKSYVKNHIMPQWVAASQTRSQSAISAIGYTSCGMMGSLRGLQFRRSR